ncbi:MAG: BrnT family toxin [Thermoguttaceae bacterium]|jgi:uncharacterized DUF497 family protein
MALTFEWDRKKASSNIRKHKVSFEEAITVFDNPIALIFDDEKYSTDAEIREIIIGHSIQNRLLLVSFTERGKDVIRIISARPATKKENMNYEENATF